MKLSGAGYILWMCATSRVLAAASSSTLAIKQCEILEYTSITCNWETTSHEANSSYRLQVYKTDCESEDSFISVGVCDTGGSQCSIQPIDSTLHCFCANVLLSTSSGSRRSPHFCFSGVNHVKLHPPKITHLGPSEGRPGCVQVGWEMRYTLPDSEKSYRRFEMEYSTHGQTRPQTVQANSRDRTEVCDLFPGSRYIVRLRAQDSRAAAHWSSWTSREFMTVEKAPSAAPRVWRHIQPAEQTRKRNLTLLWKALSWPEANGVVRSYTACCRSHADSAQWSCVALDASKTSCNLTISVDACNCSLTAANSAGTSPLSYIYIPGHTDAELPPPKSISVIPLNDTRLKLDWTTAPNQSETGFVVQWISIPHNGTTSLHWQHLNETSRSFILTGLLPEVPYNLSVVSLYGEKAGQSLSRIVFTREGAPSVGPKLTVRTSGRSIHLQWEPVPIEKLHGFITNHSILYSINGKDKRKQVEGDVKQISLNELMEGTYNICVMAHTVAGGAAGPWQMVAVGNDDIRVIPMLLCALLLICIILILPVCMRVRIKRCLCPTVPDPSKSSLSAWSNSKAGRHRLTTSSTVSSFFSVGETTCFHNYGEKDSGPVQLLSYRVVQHKINGNEVEPDPYNSTSAQTDMDPKLQVCQLRIEGSTPHFHVDFINQSYIKPDQSVSAGYQEDYPSLSEPFLETVLTYQSNPAAPDDLCGYIHVSQSYSPVVTTVDAYRTLTADECSHFSTG